MDCLRPLKDCGDSAAIRTANWASRATRTMSKSLFSSGRAKFHTLSVVSGRATLSLKIVFMAVGSLKNFSWVFRPNSLQNGSKYVLNYLQDYSLRWSSLPAGRDVFS